MELNLFKVGARKVGLMQQAYDSFAEIDSGGGGGGYNTTLVQDGGGGGSYYTDPAYVEPVSNGDAYYMPVDSSPTLYTPKDPLVDLQTIDPIQVDPAPVYSAPQPTDTVQQSGTTQTTDTTGAPVDYMESYGTFVDKDGNPVIATWQWYNVATGEVYSQQVSNQFHVWGDTDLENVALLAKAKGFSQVQIKALDMLPQFDIVMKKIPYFLYAAAVAAFILWAKQKKKKQVGAITMEQVMPFLYIGGGLLAFDVVQKILRSLGIWESPETKNLDTLSQDPNSFWSPNFYLTLLSQGVQWTTGINTATADQWLDDLKNAMGFFGDNESVVIGILKRCRTQATLSFLAWEYNYNTGGDFLSFLRGRDSWYPWAGLSDSDIYKVSQYISNLPKY